MAQAFPREQFTIPGATSELPGEVINMISPTDDVKGPINFGVPEQTHYRRRRQPERRGRAHGARHGPRRLC